jgi:hypothetical protein
MSPPLSTRSRELIKEKSVFCKRAIDSRPSLSNGPDALVHFLFGDEQLSEVSHLV